MPPAPKPANRRQGRGRPEIGLVPALSAVEIPDPPEGLLKVTQDQWIAFWNSETAGMIRPQHQPAVDRLFTLRDERERCYRSAKENRLVEGSHKQMVLNPLYKQMSVLDAEIRQLEDRLGGTPMSELKLGVEFGHAQRAYEKLLSPTEDDVDDPRSVIDIPSAEPG